MKKSNKKENKNKFGFLLLFILGGFLLKLFSFLSKKKKIDLDNIKDNFSDFIKKEEKEVKELVQGKESFKKYRKDSVSILKDYFIPYDGNNHKPKILRSKPLLTIVIFSILLKIVVSGSVFFIYPNIARLQQEITTEILILINEDRRNNNLENLEINQVLSSAATAKANDMISSDYFSHYGLDGKKPWDWVDRSEYAYLNIGENLAMNFSSANSAHSALMQSPSHKKNILNGGYQDIGLAVISGEINGKNTTILVEMFGSRKEIVEVKKIEIVEIAKVEIEDEKDSLPIENIETETKVLAIEKNNPESIINEQEENITNLSKEKAQEIETEAEDKQESIIAQIESESNLSQKRAQEVEGGQESVIAQIELEDDLSQEKVREVETSVEDEQRSVIAQIESENNLNQKISYVAQQKNNKISVVSTLMTISNYFYITILIAIIILLFVNIFKRISVQHKSVIVQSFLVIILLTGLLVIKFQALEGLIREIAIV